MGLRFIKIQDKVKSLENKLTIGNFMSEMCYGKQRLQSVKMS